MSSVVGLRAGVRVTASGGPSDRPSSRTTSSRTSTSTSNGAAGLGQTAPKSGGGPLGGQGCGVVGSRREPSGNTRADAAQPQPAASSMAMTYEVHPDAVRRREEARQRRASRHRAMQAERAGLGWWEVDKPSNVTAIESKEDFKTHMTELEKTRQLVVVDFFAPWCRACRSLYPKLTQIASRNPEVHFLKVNVEPEELKSMSENLGVDRLPYFHFYKGDGVGMARLTHFTANLNPAQLQKLRREIAEHKN